MEEFVDFLREYELEPAAVREVAIADWGGSVHVHCCHDPYGVPQEFRLHFTECSHLRWAAHEDSIDAGESETDIIGLEVAAQHRGIGVHRAGDNVAVLMTTTFELIISYRTFALEQPRTG